MPNVQDVDRFLLIEHNIEETIGTAVARSEK